MVLGLAQVRRRQRVLAQDLHRVLGAREVVAHLRRCARAVCAQTVRTDAVKRVCFGMERREQRACQQRRGGARVGVRLRRTRNTRPYAPRERGASTVKSATSTCEQR